jgi:GNAT superfamily N-acetyltransferase
VTGSVDLAVLERWLIGWSRSRGLPLPVQDGGGLRVDVGWPDQLRRHVFIDAGAALQACADRIDAPFIFVKAAVDSDQLRSALPAHWAIEAPRYLMRCAGPMPASAILPAGYAIAASIEHGTDVLHIEDVSGATAATGRITIGHGTAVFDRIETSEVHRRKGLASVIMLALDRLAIAAGATERLLVATAAGATLYEHLGWQHLAPFSTAVLQDVPAQSMAGVLEK